MIYLKKAGVFDSVKIFRDMKKTPDRVTEYYEIELYVSGSGDSCIDGISYPHKKGRLLFVRPGQTRYSHGKFICFYIRCNLDGECASLLKSLPSSMEVSDFKHYKKLFSDIILLSDSNRKEENPFLIQSKIFKLLDRIATDARRLEHFDYASGSVPPEAIHKALSFMDQSYAKPLKLGDIAEHAGFSPVYFHSAFTRYMGKTPHDYLQERRLEAAKALLLTTDLPVGSIIERCGFSSHSYFDAAFKKHCGITPGAFRKTKYSL